MPNEPSAEETRLIAFIERDYTVAQEAAGSMENAVVASRSIGFTLVAALLGVGLSQKSWVIVLLAAVAGVAAYVIDGYYSWRLKQRELYLRGLEKAVAANYAAIQRAPNNKRELNKLATVLEGVRVGANSQIRRFDWSDAWFNEPVMLFKGLYPVMIAAAVVATAVFGVHAIKADHDQEGLAECQDGVRVTLASPLHVRPGRGQGLQITVPTARAECGPGS